jgi:SAM-dependent methyltransferase
MPSGEDKSNGYESVANDFIAARSARRIGEQTVREWAQTLPCGASVLDIGCGGGVPVTETLLDLGLHVYGVDGSPSMIEAFRQRFPAAPAHCADLTADPDLFGLEFHAAIAWGVLFLLLPDAQRALINRIARALRPGGRFAFTAPEQATEWTDVMTGRKSISLGRSAYIAALAAAGFHLDTETQDEGGNHYYFATKQR